MQVDESLENPQATCPSCSMAICVPCRVVWHDDLTCEEYQALPLDDRSPEDQQALKLMKAQHWRRCPKCSFIVELTHGCNHITCRCKTEFCFRCGSLWSIHRKSCTRNPPCDLWDEDLLVERRERHQGGQPVAVPPQNEPPPPPPNVANNLNPNIIGMDMFGWIIDAHVRVRRHPFTGRMIRTLSCGYCNSGLLSLEYLRQHLEGADHNVFACCGRFFGREQDFDRHWATQGPAHAHTVRRMV